MLRSAESARAQVVHVADHVMTVRYVSEIPDSVSSLQVRGCVGVRGKGLQVHCEETGIRELFYDLPKYRRLLFFQKSILQAKPKSELVRITE